jgi:alpha-beta hydrolase superfamily lysophospholipase
VVLVHGLGEHCRASVYEWLVPRFAAAGLAVWRFDLRGHGRSPGRPLTLDRWEDFLADLDSVLERIGQPALVFGFSLGGLIALDHQRLNPAKHLATLAMAPPLGEPAVPRVLLHFARGVNHIAPHWIVRTPWLPRFSRFPSPELDSYRTDPLIRCAITSRLAVNLLERSRQLRRWEAWVRPVLLLQGERDQICPAQANLDFAKRTQFEVRLYSGARHHLLLEECRDHVARDAAAWALSQTR